MFLPSLRVTKPNGTNSRMDLRRFRSRNTCNMLPTGYDDKSGDNHLVEHGARGQKISFSNRKVDGKKPKRRSCPIWKICHCSNGSSLPDSIRSSLAVLAGSFALRAPAPLATCAPLALQATPCTLESRPLHFDTSPLHHYGPLINLLRKEEEKNSLQNSANIKPV